MTKIKKSLWERLKVVEGVMFSPWHKGLDISWSFVKGSDGGDVDSSALEFELGEFFYYNQADRTDEFIYCGEMNFVGGDRETPTYTYFMDAEYDGEFDLPERILGQILPDLEKLNAEEFELKELSLNYCSEKGSSSMCEVHYERGDIFRDLKLNDSLRQIIGREVHECLKEHFQNPGSFESVDIFFSELSMFQEVCESTLFLEIVEDELWSKDLS